MTTPDVLAIAPTMDRVGFHACDFSSSTHMAVSVRFHREDPWERFRLVSAAMPNTPLSFITTGMRFISWVPADEELMRLSFRCVVRNGIRRFQIADPSNDPVRAAAAGRDGAAGGRRGGRDRADLLGQPGAHARVLRRAGGRARRLRRDGPALPQGPRRPADAGRRARAGAALPAARRAASRSSCTATARSGSRRSSTWRALRAGFQVLHTAAGAARARAPRIPPRRRRSANLEAEGFSHRLDLDALAAVSEHFRALAREQGPAGRAPAGVRRRPTTTTSSPAGWSRRRGGCSRSCAGRSCSTPCSRRSVACGRRWATRSSSRRSPSSSPRRPCGTSWTASAGRPSPTRPCATSSATTASRPRRSRRTSPTGCSRARAPRTCGTSSRCTSMARASASATRISDEELLLRLTMPEEQVDAALAAQAPPTRAGPPGRDPVVTLLQEVARRRSRSRQLRVQKGDDLVVWRRARSLTSRASSSTSTGRSCTARAASSSVLPGAVEFLERIRASGRPFVAVHERQPRRAGDASRPRSATQACHVGDDELLTPLVSVQSWLRARRPGGSVSLFGGEEPHEYLRRAGVRLVEEDPDVVFVAHVGHRRLRPPRARGPGGDRRRAPAHRQLPARLRGRERADPQPRRDDRGRNREGLERAAARRRQAVARGAARDRGPARRRRPASSPSSATM